MKEKTIWLLLLPLAVGVAATQTDYLPFKMAVPSLCALILLWAYQGLPPGSRQDVAAVVLAFVFSAVGDYFLSNKSGTEIYFVVGIGLYFVAHLGYLAYAWRNGRIHRPILGVLLVGYLLYYVVSLNPAIGDPVLSGAVLLYLLISCLALAVAAGLTLPAEQKWLYVFGIGMIVLSDTAISFNEFLGYRAFNWLILPTYYLAHLTVSLSLLLRQRQAAHSPAIAGD
ncbi:MAG: lysoplasmalogenase [Candidatus Promineifilaceae bacterium]